MEYIDHFHIGRSGCSVSTIKYDNKVAVIKEKIKDVSGILALYDLLDFPMPEIYEHTDQYIIMEYIDGVHIKDFIKTATSADIQNLIDYISSYFNYCISKNSYADFSNFIHQKTEMLSPYLKGIDISLGNSKYLSGISHGDFTFDNIIYKDGTFYMIDLTPSANSGIHFDANKLCQDLIGHWFIRDEPIKDRIIDNCNLIYAELATRFPTLFDYNLYKFMFARVLPYCQNDAERDYIIKTLSR